MSEFFSASYEDLLFLLARYGAVWFYIFLFLSSVTENLFPPYPGDTIAFAGGLLAISGLLNPIFTFFSVCFGGLVGCLILYSLGQTTGRKAFLHDRGWFLNRQQLEKIENWFGRYGNWVIVVSRFLPGVRSGVALAAGVGNVRLPFMVAYSLVSIMLWNLFIMFSANLIHNNWRKLYELTRIYNGVALTILVIVIIVGIIILRRKNR
jgi:membrane protein DedA with SNARE-associated domain